MQKLLHEYSENQQTLLALYCRSGVVQKLDGISPNRVHHYRRLVYNNVIDALESAYPLTHRLLSEKEWNKLVDEFWSNNTCQSVSIWKMPLEFYSYFLRNNHNLKLKYKHLENLLLFEWMEIELYMMEDKTVPTYKIKGNWEKDLILFNPESTILELDYPVHTISPNKIGDTHKDKYFVLLFREPASGKVRFLDISHYFAWLIEKIYQGEALFTILTEAEPIFNVEYKVLLENSLRFLIEMSNQNFVLGFAK